MEAEPLAERLRLAQEWHRRWVRILSTSINLDRMTLLSSLDRNGLIAAAMDCAMRELGKEASGASTIEKRAPLYQDEVAAALTLQVIAPRADWKPEDGPRFVTAPTSGAPETEPFQCASVMVQ